MSFSRARTKSSSLCVQSEWFDDHEVLQLTGTRLICANDFVKSSMLWDERDFTLLCRSIYSELLIPVFQTHRLIALYIPYFKLILFYNKQLP